MIQPCPPSRGEEKIMRHWKSAVLLPLLALGAAQAMACYTVYDRSNMVVYQSEKPPVDMSRPLHETLPQRFPGGHMVFDGGECTPVNSLAIGAGGRTPSSSPMLTNQKSALEMHVPHRQLAGGIALVAPGHADVPAGVTVVPSTVMATAPDTRVLGAARAPAERPVITEYRDPPVTVIRRGDDVTIQRR
jgi:hypothetical protein